MVYSILLAIAFAVASKAKTLKQSPPPSTLLSEIESFTIHSRDTISEINGKSIFACGQGFRISNSKFTQAGCMICPTEVAYTGVCASMTNTTIINNGGMTLDVLVPGGQRIYVSLTSDIPGHLSYTAAYHTNIPPNVSLDLSVHDNGPNTPGSYVYSGTDATPVGGDKGSSWVACPREYDQWDIYARIQGTEQDEIYKKEKCVGLEIGTDEETEDRYGAYLFT